nr:hypothetical protein [Bifidobacterium indicum]
MKAKRNEADKDASFRLEREQSKLDKYQKLVDDPTTYVDNLKAAQQHYSEPTEFSAGDIVEWKPNMKMAPFPTYSAPAVVVRMLDDSVEIASSVLPMAESVRYDMLIGVIDGDGDFAIFKAYSACMKKWQAA